jgi:predicted kinase
VDIPTFILVTGAPGSGKTTLSRQLADHLRLPLMSRDAVRTGLFHASGGWTDAPSAVPSTEESIAVFLQMLEFALERGVSVVGDYLFFRTGFPPGCRVRDLASVVVIRTITPVATTRCLDRIRKDPYAQRPGVLAARGFTTIEQRLDAAAGQAATLEPELFDGAASPYPHLAVDTTDGYSPGLEAIVDFVLTCSPRIRRG